MSQTTFSQLTVKEQTSCILRIKSLRNEENWQGQLEFLEKILADDNSVTRQNRQLWYFRAVALDMLGRSSEAIVILKTLTTVFPINVSYRHSLNVTVLHLTHFAIDKFSSDRGNPEIETYYKAALENNYSAWNLTEIYLDHLMLVEQVEKAKYIISSYIQLSPFDHSFLEKGLQIASNTNDAPMIKKLLDNVQLGLSFNPYNDELSTLLTQYFVTGESEAS